MIADNWSVSLVQLAMQLSEGAVGILGLAPDVWEGEKKEIVSKVNYYLILGPETEIHDIHRKLISRLNSFRDARIEEKGEKTAAIHFDRGPFRSQIELTTLDESLQSEFRLPTEVILVTSGQADNLTVQIVRQFTEEFSYPVAPDLQKFVAMFDCGLVPTGFYQYYQRSTKIINHSNFDIYRAGKKVFVRPYIIEFDEEKKSFHTLAAEGSSLLYMDKVRKGETLDDTLRRILKHELKIADDYIGARADRDEFDRDKQGLLIPRSKVFVFVEEIKDKAGLKQKSQRPWLSMEETKKKLDVS